MDKHLNVRRSSDCFIQLNCESFNIQRSNAHSEVERSKIYG